MKTTIKVVENNLGGHSYYLKHLNKEYYLFSQDFHMCINNYFSKERFLSDVIKNKKIRQNKVISRTVDKFKPYIKYIEREYNVSIYGSYKRKIKTI